MGYASEVYWRHFQNAQPTEDKIKPVDFALIAMAAI